MSNPILSVVIADDEMSIRQGLRNAVQWEELNTRVTNILPDGKQALNCILQTRPDICIIDIRMPILDGLEVIRQCKESKIPTEFIILSGYNDFTYAQKAIQYGVKCYLLKPLDLEKLKEEFYRLYNEITKRNSIHIDLEKLRENSRKQFLNHLIRGETYQLDNLNQQIVTLQLKLSNSPSRILICSIQNTKSTPDFEEDAIAQLQECLCDFPCEIWSMNSYQLLILYNDPNEDSSLSMSIAKRCLWKLSALDNCVVGIGIGARANDLSQTAHSYTSALLASSYQLYSDKPAIHNASDICSQPPTLSPSSIDYSRLADIILNGDEKACDQYCSGFFHTLFYVPQPPPSFAKSMCLYLAVNVLKELNSTCTPGQSYPEITYEEFNRAVSFPKLKEWMIDYFHTCCRLSLTFHQKNLLSAEDPIIAAAKAYIDRHKKSSLKTREIAASVNLSDSYCSAYFKQKTGVNLRDYILKVKMDYAIKMIQEDGMQIQTVAYELGYQDYRSFSRAFKNLFGVSPSEYINK